MATLSIVHQPLRRNLMRLALVAAAAYDALYLALWLARGSVPRFGDFFAFWTFGRFALTPELPSIYDPAVLQRFQHGLEPAFTAAYPFIYPPTLLLAVTPLAILPLSLAWAGWSLAGLACYVAAVAGRSWRSCTGAALLVAPTTLLCLVGGQAGLLSAALLLGGLRAVPSRPWLGGALLGLLTLKPQFGLLVPVALVAAGQWRVIAAACLTAGALVLAAGCVFGWQVWAAWGGSLPADATLVLRNRDGVAQLMPTVSAGLYQLGVADGPAQLAQLASAALAACMTWRAFRSGVTPGAVAVLAMATFLATPYAYIYDLPIVTGALVMLLPGCLTEALLAGLVATVPLMMLRVALPLAEPLLLAAILVLHRRSSGAGNYRSKPPGYPAGSFPPGA